MCPGPHHCPAGNVPERVQVQDRKKMYQERHPVIVNLNTEFRVRCLTEESIRASLVSVQSIFLSHRRENIGNMYLLVLRKLVKKK